MEIALFLESRLYASPLPAIRTMISHQEHGEVPRLVRLRQRDLPLGDHKARVQHVRRLLVLAEQSEVVALRLTHTPHKYHPPQEAQTVVQVTHNDELLRHLQRRYIPASRVLVTQLLAVGHVHHADL